MQCSTAASKAASRLAEHVTGKKTTRRRPELLPDIPVRTFPIPCVSAFDTDVAADVRAAASSDGHVCTAVPEKSRTRIKGPRRRDTERESAHIPLGACEHIPTGEPLEPAFCIVPAPDRPPQPSHHLISAGWLVL